MTTEQQDRVRQLFGAAIDMEPEKAKAFLEAADAEPAVRNAALQLFSEHYRAGSFLRTLTQFEEETAAESSPRRRFRDGEIVAQRYRVVRFVQAGGMGEVYEAEDRKLQQRVALKTILPRIAPQESFLRRFRREIAVARRVTHPNVCRVFDVGEDSGDDPESIVVFLTMEFLPGETLAARLGREGRLSAADALPIVEQLGEALAAAHEVNVIHRDFKPGNVILCPGRGERPRAVVTDFGLARTIGGVESEESALTGTAAVIGTPAYMAPEQFSGGEPGPATDIYAFGLVIYEMITGRRPFSAGTPFGELVARLQSIPAPVSSVVADAGPEWDAVVSRCLQRRPEERFQDAREVAAGLKRGVRPMEPAPSAAISVSSRARHRAVALLMVLLLVVVVLAVPPVRERVTGWFGVSTVVPEAKRLAILPFANVGDDASMQALCDGLVETLTSALSGLKAEGLAVVSAAEIVSSNPSTATQARDQFGADLVVTGSIQRMGKAVRLTLNVVETRNLTYIDAATINGGEGQIQTIQDQAVAKLIGILKLRTDPEGEGQQAFRAANPAAYEPYVKAVGYLQRWDKGENLDAAIDLLREAVEQDQGFALAHAKLGEAYRMKYVLEHDSDSLNRALEQARHAVEINGELAPVQVTLGRVYSAMGKDDLALETLSRALELDAHDPDVHLAIAKVYEKLGRTDEAEQSYIQALNLAPEFWRGRNALADFYYRRQRYEEAILHWERVLESMRNNAVVCINLGAAYASVRRLEDARAMYERAIKIEPHYMAYMNLGTLYFQQGDFARSTATFEQALKLDDSDYLVWGNLGDARWWTPGAREQAKPAYERAIRMAEEVRQRRSRDKYVHADLARYNAQVGRRQVAVERAEAALALAPDDREVLVWVAEVYEILSRRDRAVGLLRKAIDLGYPREELRNNPGLAGLLEQYPVLRQESKGATTIGE